MMKKFIFITLALTAFTLSANAVMVTVTVDGQAYLLRYRNNVTFDAYQTTIDDAPWWDAGGTATDFAAAANIVGLRFAYDEQTFGATDYALYRNTAGSSNDASSNSANYAVSAVPVPGPLPLLGVLPFVGFLRKMRRQQFK